MRLHLRWIWTVSKQTQRNLEKLFNAKGENEDGEDFDEFREDLDDIDEDETNGNNSQIVSIK